MNRVILVLIIIAVSGCAQKLNGYDVRKANDYCADKDGIHHLDMLIGPSVKCNDGTFEMLSTI